ncbi:helix-turn-helix domain-containing protein [Halomicroarcula sp. GCM10025817]|uniref:helix-turn-helix domain-containing protein n=1 Tax=Haloarcula TaxID=2237 RepID=UPI0023E8BBFE|nr:helix-turn-helix domain-containing protein [Halomicroarcula sp. SYNS111]
MLGDRTTVARFSLPAKAFPLGAVFEKWPDARIELDRFVPSAGSTMPYFWVHDADAASITSLLAERPEFESVAVADDLGDRALFRAEWSPQSLGLFHSILESDVTIITGIGTTDGWSFELRGNGRATIAGFMQRCHEYDVPASLIRVGDVSKEPTSTGGALTEHQEEALLLAFSEGYYEEPRQTDLQSLAATIGITRQAFSSRLRRGYKNFIAATLVEGTENSI